MYVKFQSDTVNPFENSNKNGLLNPSILEENKRIDELSAESGQLSLMQDQQQELADLRRHVVFLQVHFFFIKSIKFVDSFFFFFRVKLTIVIEQYVFNKIYLQSLRHKLK